MRETWVRSLGWEDPLEKEMATRSSILAWKTSWTEEPGRLQSMVSQRAGHDWATSLHFKSILLVELQNMKMKFTFSIAFVIAHCIEIIMTMALNQFKNFDIFFTKYITCLHRVTILLKWENCKGICCDNMCLFSRKKYMIWKYS